MAYAEKSEVNFAEGAELEKVKELMGKLEPELAALREAGLDFSHTTGEIFFTRLLRGNNGDVEEGIKWYKKFLELRKTHELDAIHKDCEAKNISWMASKMPEYDAVKAYQTTVFDENELRCPSGNIMWYDAYGDFKSRDLLKDVGQERYVKFCHYMFERRTSMLDAISKKEGKIVKITRVMDFEHTSMSTFGNKEYDKINKQLLEPILMGTSCETVHLIFLINFPRVLVAAFNVLCRLFPKRLVARFRVLGTDYMQDKEYLTECGADITKKVIAYSKAHAELGGVADDSYKMDGDDITIKPRTGLERIVEVKPGQTVSWKYTMGASGAGSSGGYFSKLAGKVAGSEVYFSVKAFWTDTQASNIELLHAQVVSAGVDDGDMASFSVGGTAVDYTAGAGVNLVAVDPLTKALILGKAFDMAKDADAANKEFVAAIQGLPRACFVLVGVKGTGAEELSPEAWEQLQDCGSTLKGGGHWHKGYAFIGVKGGVSAGELRGGKVVAEGGMQTMEMEAVLLPPAEANAESGEKTGSMTVDRGGMLILRWDNEHAMVASKCLQKYEITTA